MFMGEFPKEKSITLAGREELDFFAPKGKCAVVGMSMQVY
jgi:hypothetical protein